MHTRALPCSQNRSTWPLPSCCARALGVALGSHLHYSLKPVFQFRRTFDPGLDSRVSVGTECRHPTFLHPNDTQGQKQKAPPLLMEMWGLPLESNLSEPWLIGGVRQALLNRLLLSACFVNEFARLAKIRMETRGHALHPIQSSPKLAGSRRGRRRGSSPLLTTLSPICRIPP